MHDCILNLDKDGSTDIQIAESKGIHAVRFEDVTYGNETVPMLVRYNQPMRRHVVRDRETIASMLVLLTYLVRVVSAQEVMKFRQMLLHPWSLLIESEEPGRISLGPNVSLTVFVVTNVLKASEEHKNGGIDAVYSSRFCQRKRLPKSHAFETPTKILSIQDPKSTGIRAVIVVEHRNVGTQIEWVKEYMHGTIIVMTGGYASTGTKEFLNVLWRELPSSVAFLFCSDHDPASFHIYSTLKWGACKSAALSQDTVCPRLQWFSPTRDIVLDRLDEYMRVTYPKDNRRKSANECEVDRQNAKKAVEKLMTKPLAPKAIDILNGMEKRGYADKDPVLREEFDALKAGNAHFGLSMLSEYQPHGMEFYLINVAHEVTGPNANTQPLLHELRSQDLKQFDAFSEAVGMPSSSTRMALSRPVYTTGHSDLSDSEVIDVAREELSQGID
ncbi:hypothetical protein BDR22DRAFT_883881 [Usnea florida]